MCTKISTKIPSKKRNTRTFKRLKPDQTGRNLKTTYNSCTVKLIIIENGAQTILRLEVI